MHGYCIGVIPKWACLQGYVQGRLVLRSSVRQEHNASCAYVAILVFQHTSYLYTYGKTSSLFQLNLMVSSILELHSQLMSSMIA